MIKKFTSEIIMDNRRAKIKDLIERNVFSIPRAAEYFYVSEGAIKSDLESMDLDPEKYMDRSDNEQKEIEKLKEELQGIKENDYDEAIAHVANQRIKIDLDDGVKVNYAKFQGVEVAQEGKKALKVDLLAKI